MNLIEYLESIPMTHALGWTLVHFVWQGVLLALLVKAVLHALSDRGANARYLVCCAGMALMMAVPLATLIVIARMPNDPIAEEISTLLSADLQSLTLWTRLSTSLPVMTFFWLAGTLLFQGRLVVHWTSAQRIKVRGTRPAPAEWQRVLSQLCKKMNIHQPVRLLESSLARVPMVIGWLRPVILVPATVLTGLPPRQLRMVIAHELAHVRRYDYIVNLVQAVFESLLFYHPAVWWLSNRLRVEREYCCDDVVVRLGRDALCYARALSLLDAMRGDECRTAPASTGGLLMNRIFRIAGVPVNRTNRLGGWLTLLVVLLSLSAALSAMGLSPITAAAGEKNSEPSAVTRNYYVPFGYACEVEALVEKMKSKGKTHAQIQDAILGMSITLVEEDDKIAKSDSDEAKLIKEMKAKGMSDEEIKKALHHMHQKKKTAEKQKAVQAAKERELIEKLKAKGLTGEEIKKYLHEQRLKEKKAREDKLLRDKKEKEFIEQMKAKGMSDEQIKKALHDIQLKELKAKEAAKKKQAAMEKAKREKEEQAFIAELKAKGLSDKEIKTLLFEKRMREKTSGALKKKKVLKDKEQKLIDEMRAKGMSDEEIKKALKEKQKKEEAAKKAASR